MSLVQFDEMYEICCEVMENDERFINAKPTIEPLEVLPDDIPNSNRWWEAVIEDILKEKEREIVYV